jgi:hypothetical protein
MASTGRGKKNVGQKSEGKYREELHPKDNPAGRLVLFRGAVSLFFFRQPFSQGRPVERANGAAAHNINL